MPISEIRDNHNISPSFFKYIFSVCTRVSVCVCVCMIVYITYVCVNVHKYMHIHVQYVCIYKCTRILCVYIYIGIYTQKFNFNTRLEDRGSCYAHIPNCNIIPCETRANIYARVQITFKYDVWDRVVDRPFDSISFPLNSLVKLRLFTFSIIAHGENLYNIVD